jgi:hypothetical protein
MKRLDIAASLSSEWLTGYIHEHGGVMTVTTELVAD